MRRLYGYSTKGMRLLVMAIFEDVDMTELQRLALETHYRIAEEWRGYPKGLKLALAVFDDLCSGYYDTQISLRRKVSRERIRQVHDNLADLKCVQEMGEKLKEIQNERTYKLNYNSKSIV